MRRRSCRSCRERFDGERATLCRTCRDRKRRERNWRIEKARNTWRGMIRRCHVPGFGKRYATGVPRFEDYGAKGISVAPCWRESFEAFVEDVGLPRSRSVTLDRIDPEGDYEPGNVRWVGPLMQKMNQRHTRWLTALDGEREETLSVGEWSRRSGTPASTIRARLDRGWNHEDAIFGRDSSSVPF